MKNFNSLLEDNICIRYIYNIYELEINMDQEKPDWPKN